MCFANTPPAVSPYGSFENLNPSIPVYVPCNSLVDYQNVWSYFDNFQCITEIFISDTICFGSSYTEYGFNENQTGTYYNILADSVIELTLNIPINVAITGGTFTVTLPAGISIDIANCVLSALLAGNYDLTITDNGNGSWIFTLTPKPFYANRMRIVKQTANYQDIMYIAYTLSADLADGSYTAVISDLHFTFADETEIIQNEIPVIISINEETGIKNILANQISIYPNPVKSELFINFSKVQSFGKVSSVEITDLSGRKMVNGMLSNGKSINVSTLPAGIYFVKIQTDKGVVTQKFIKE